MTNASPQPPYNSAGRPPANPGEDVIKGAMFALLALPVGVVLLVLLSSVGFVASIVGFVVAFLALWLYRRGSGGFISRNGAWAVTGVVVVTLLVGIWADIVVGAVGIGHIGDLTDPAVQQQISDDFGTLLNDDKIFILLVLAFGALGAYRTLHRAFSVASQPRTTEQLFGQAPATGTTVYQNDVDGSPSGSADDKTPPPTVGH